MIGLADFRRPLSVRNLDVLAVLSFSVHLWYFNEGRVFASAIAAAVSLAYLIGRAAWMGCTNRASPAATLLPVWLLVGATVLLMGFRVGLNLQQDGVLDVGYAGVIGAQRIADGTAPYGRFPERETGRPCGQPTADGEIADWVQANGRCETALPLGDTYGPVNYHAYLPGLAVLGWSGKWDRLPAVRFTTLLFDLLALLGLAAVGLRFGGTRLAAVLAFAWAANPFTQYVSSSNANDAIMPAFLIWGFWAASSDVGRGSLAALAAWAKLAALVVVPLWATYPNVREWRRTASFSAAFAVTTALSFWILVVGGEPIEGFGGSTSERFQIQFDRRSPFSLWDWGQYRAGPARPPLAPAALAGGPRCSCACVRPTPEVAVPARRPHAALLMGSSSRSLTGRRSTSHGSSRSSPWRFCGGRARRCRVEAGAAALPLGASGRPRASRRSSPAATRHARQTSSEQGCVTRLTVCSSRAWQTGRERIPSVKAMKGGTTMRHRNRLTITVLAGAFDRRARNSGGAGDAADLPGDQVRALQEAKAKSVRTAKAKTIRRVSLPRQPIREYEP